MTRPVLVADDNLVARADLREALSSSGFAATPCDSRAAATRLFQSVAFDAIVLGLSLSAGESATFLSELRANAVTASLPVLVLSGHASIAHRIAAVRAGATDVLAKPFDRRFVVRRLRHWLERGAVRTGETSGEPARILLVDDSQTYSLALADELQRGGHDVVSASSGASALEYLAVQSVDAVVLDVFMPGIDGLEVCRRVRTDTVHRDVPVLLLTGRTDSTVRVSGMEAGADELIAKSPDLAQLRARVEGLLALSRSERRLRRGSNPGVTPAHPLTRVLPAITTGRHAAVAQRRSTTRLTATVFDQVVAASGLSDLVARSSMEQVCRRCGIDPSSMTTSDLARAMPEIVAALTLFLSSEKAAEARDLLDIIAGRPASAL